MAVALIPARMGSKGIPGKNWTSLAGITPVERAVTCCMAAGVQPYISSDLPNEAQWPFWVARPADLALDHSSMRDVVLDFLSRVPGEPHEAILLVQPTQPLRTPDMLRSALTLLDQYPSVASLTPTTSVNKMYGAESGYLQPLGLPVERRQDARPTFRCDGTVYAFRRQAFLDHPAFVTRHTYALLIHPSDTAELDTLFDWEMAELRLKARHAHTPTPSAPASE